MDSEVEPMHKVAAVAVVRKAWHCRIVRQQVLGVCYLTITTKYLLVDQNRSGSVMRSTYCLLASR